MSAAVQQLFNGIAYRYDVLNQILSFRRDLAWRKRAARLAKIPTQWSVLDLCGGTGAFIQAVRENAPNKPFSLPQRVPPEVIWGQSVIGDFSLGMLKQAPAKFVSKPYGVPTVLGMDALKIPFVDASFEAVFIGFGIRNLDNAEEGLREIHRVLKPGGRLITLEFFRPTHAFTKFFYHVVAPLAIPVLGGWLSRKSAYDYLVKSVQKFITAHDYLRLCQIQGFIELKSLACDGGIAHIVMGTKVGVADSLVHYDSEMETIHE